MIILFRFSSRDEEVGVALITFRREPLEEYLAASNSVLIQMFDFTLSGQGESTRWPDGPEEVVTMNDRFFYRQKVDPGKAAYTRGVQIIPPGRPKGEIFTSLNANGSGKKESHYVEFVALDRRNNRITKISTDPTATTNYFEAHNNTLPFELSPAFFRPEVLSKYKVRSRQIHDRRETQNYTLPGCMGIAQLLMSTKQGKFTPIFATSEVFPIRSSRIGRASMRSPKTGISKRALEHDIRGEWTSIVDPLEDIRSIAERWANSDLTGWHLREESLLERVNTPRTSSRDEWAQAFMDLSKLIVEGFQVKGHTR